MEEKSVDLSVSDLKKQLGRSALILLFMGHLGATLPLFVLPWLLVFQAETLGGRMVGLAFVLLILGFLAVWVLSIKRARTVGRWSTGGLLFGSLCSWGVAVALAPADEIQGGKLSSHHEGASAFSKYGLTNVVPEIDQLKLGTILLPLTDPYIDQQQGSALQESFLSIYREMREDPEFIEVGSALGLCYKEIFFGQRETLHTYEYVPAHLERDRYPVIIFLHGSLGNFKGYLWVLKRLADEHGFAVLAPTYGAGNWERDETGSVVSASYERCLQDSRFDQDSIILAGLSNGGKGVVREMRDHGERYKGFIFLSPVLEIEIVSSPQFRMGDIKKPILIIHGEMDRRIPIKIVRAGERHLRENGFLVTAHYHSGEDHFLFFSRRFDVIANISAWLGQEL